MVDRAQRPVVGRGQPQIRPLAGALQVSLDQLEADPGQPRKDWKHHEGERRLAELVESIREFGVLQPLLVTEVDGDGPLPRYRVIAGGRRLQAARLAGLAGVPVVVREADLTQMRIMQLTENLQRQELAPLDEARGFQELMDIKEVSAPAVAALLHVSSQHVRDRLRLLADQILADAVERRQIGASVAREVLKLPDDELEALRNRVERGERLQMNDIAKARARLQAEGIFNPRRNVRKEPREIALSPVVHVPAETAVLPENAALTMPLPASTPSQDRPSIGVVQTMTSPAPKSTPEDTADDAAPDAAPREPETITLSALALAALLRSALKDVPQDILDQVLHVQLPRHALRAALAADCQRLAHD
jgi:ParB family chromosome partitioning protein